MYHAAWTLGASALSLVQPSDEFMSTLPLAKGRKKLSDGNQQVRQIKAVILNIDEGGL